MGWTYEQDFSNNRDKVRLLMGDTDYSDQLMDDEEIAFLITENDDDVYYAAADALETLASRFSRDTHISADGISISRGERYRSFMERAMALRKQAKRHARAGAAPYVGGISKDEEREYLTDSDLVPLHFESDMHDHPEASDRNYNPYDDDLTT